MKKILCAAGLSLGVFQLAVAQSSVAVYGLLDSGIVLENGGPAGRVTKIGGGSVAGSRLGLRGREDLGNGVAAEFVLESGINLDTGTANAGGGLFGRLAYVGLKSGAGTVTLGRQYSLIYLGVNEVADPFKTGSAGRSNNLMQMAGTRVNNALRYVSPSLAGFNLDLLYGAGEVAGNSAAGRHLGAALAYAGGPLSSRVVYTRFNDAPANSAAPLNGTRTALWVGAYDMQALRLHLGYAANRNDLTLDARDAIAGLTYTAGAHRMAASLIHHDDRAAANADVNQVAAGYFYGLSKRTELYAVYARMDRKNAAAAASFFVGNASDTGSGDRALNLGIKHVF